MPYTRFAPETNTLTLNGANIESTAAGIRATINLKIKLMGENVINSRNMGVFVKKGTIEGQGSLSVTGKTSGIRTSLNLTISGGASVSAMSQSEYGIRGGDLTISGKETVVMMNGRKGVYNGNSLTLDDGLIIGIPEGVYFDEFSGCFVSPNGNLIIADQWVTIASQDNIDGIRDLNGQESRVENQPVFNLAGQMLSGKWSNGQWPRGILIQGGRKVLIR